MKYDIALKEANGTLTTLEKYKDKVLLIVNTATHCGFTKQYEGLEKLYQSYHKNGFEILDFPCNQFAHQTPENDEEIGKFCELNYHTTFPRFEKTNVNGKNAHPLFVYLRKNSPREVGPNHKAERWLSKMFFGHKIKWNFTKFLVDKNGKIIARFSPQVKPEDLRESIEKAL